jgi:hypothetical protein
VNVGPLPAARKGEVKVSLRLTLSTEGFLKVSANESLHGQPVPAEFSQPGSDRTKSAVAQAQAEGERGGALSRVWKGLRRLGSRRHER